MRRIVFFALCILLVSCATGPVLTSLPPVTSGGFRMEEDEKRLWTRAREADENYDKAGLIFVNDGLEKYINYVAKDLQSAEVYGLIPFKARVVKSTAFNAWVLPNGSIYITTGILAGMDNEAQLASLLGHEMTHTTHRHMINHLRLKKNYDFMIVNTIATTGYSRELETEADTVGFKLMVEKGYDPDEAARLFENLQKHIQEESIPQSYFFSTHPKLQERIDNFRVFESRLGARGGRTNGPEFLQKIEPAIYENARLLYEEGRLKPAWRDAEKCLRINPKSARAYTLLGEMAARKNIADSEKEALKYFDEAISADPGYPNPYREKGRIHFKKGEKGIARPLLEKYLSLSREAADQKFIMEYIRQCSEGEGK